MAIYEFTKAVVLNLEGEVDGKAEMHKVLGTVMYQNIGDIELIPVAREIYQGKKVELDKEEIKLVEDCIRSEKSGLTTVAQASLLEYIKTVKDVKNKVSDDASD